MVVVIIYDDRPICNSALKVTGNVLNIEYYFWWRNYCFGLLIHHYALFHFIVSISIENHF